MNLRMAALVGLIGTLLSSILSWVWIVSQSSFMRWCSHRGMSDNAVGRLCDWVVVLLWLLMYTPFLYFFAAIYLRLGRHDGASPMSRPLSSNADERQS